MQPRPQGLFVISGPNMTKGLGNEVVYGVDHDDDDDGVINLQIWQIL